MSAKKLKTIKTKIFKEEKMDLQLPECSNQCSGIRHRIRRNAVEIKGRGADYTIKDGEWKLWVDTLDQEEMSALKEAFAYCDKNLSGEISQTDLGQCLKYMGENPTESEIQEMILLMKTNHRNAIEFPEFATAMAKRRRNSSEMILRAFEEFDESGDGLISVQELKNFVSKSLSDGHLTPNDFDNLMQDMDLDKDGYIDYGEFMDFTQTAL